MAEVDGGVAARVAQARKLAGLTQRQLATRTSMSLSTVRKTEQGRIPASATFVAAAARALGLLVTDLTEEPGFRSLTSRLRTEQAFVPELERAIVEYEDPFIDGPLISLDEASRTLDRVVAAGRTSRYSEALRLLPDLIRHLHALPTTMSGHAANERTHRLLTQAYQCAMFDAYKLGHLSLSAWAAERMSAAAASSGDPLWAAMGLYGRGQALMFSGAYRSSDAILNRAASAVADSPDPHALQVRGAIHLTRAILAARLSRPADADTHLSEARALARHAPADDRFDTAFSTANVDIHDVAAAVETMDGTTAVKRGTGLRLEGRLYPSRHGHFHIDMARAFLLHGDYERSVHHLQSARHLAPQQTRHHPQVHETIRALARIRRRTDPVTRLATWAGLNIGTR
jgi:transcriptional regulator with XRE-family HTH domain